MTLDISLPFEIRRSHDIVGSKEISSTTETVYGLLRLRADRLIIQWRLSRQTDRVGSEIRTDTTMEPVREVVVPLDRIAGAEIRRRRFLWWGRPRLVLRAADLRAFEQVTGEGGLSLTHPAELVLRLRRLDRLPGESFIADLALAVAEATGTQAGRPTLPASAAPALEPKS